MTPKRRLTISNLLLIGYAVLLAAVVGLGWFATGNMRQLQAITEDLYVHPFAVSNAAADLKSTLLHLRNHILDTVFVGGHEYNPEHSTQELDGLAAKARTDLAVIKANFLGDMSHVRELEAALDRWDSVRAEIMAAVRDKDYDRARQLVRTVGTRSYYEAVPQVEYILAFALNKGKQYVDEAREDSDRLIFRTRVLSVTLAIFVLATALAVFYRVRYLQRELARQATLDFLTGIPNRRHFMELAEREIHRSRRHASPFALAVVDLDWFKSINDNYGHQVGDQVLKQFCTVCRQTLRNLDVIGRIGGEEFALLMPNTRLAEACEVVERVRKTVEESGIHLADGSRMQFTGSFGLTTCSAEGQDLTALFRRADEALYEAKAAGRNRVCVNKPPS